MGWGPYLLSTLRVLCHSLRSQFCRAAPRRRCARLDFVLVQPFHRHCLFGRHDNRIFYRYVSRENRSVRVHVCLFVGMGFLCLFIVYRCIGVSCIVYRVSCMRIVCVCVQGCIHPFLESPKLFPQETSTNTDKTLSLYLSSLPSLTLLLLLHPPHPSSYHRQPCFASHRVQRARAVGLRVQPPPDCDELSHGVVSYRPGSVDPL